MRFREPFCLYKRDISGNRTVWYYKTYDENGKRTCGHSTGQTSKTKAKLYCMDLYRKGNLIPSKKKTQTDELTFKAYSKDWWDYDKCNYIQSRLARGGSFSKGHANIQKMNLKNHLIPTFGNVKLKNITPAMIEDWLMEFVKKGKSNTTANHNLQTLRIMLNEAHRLGKIKHNPIENIKPLHQKSQEKGILRPKEVQNIFDLKKQKKYWGDEQARLMNLLAASTAMRLGEVVALQCEDLKDDYIHVHRSYDRKFGLKDTKTHDSRELPLSDYLLMELRKLKEKHQTGYLFSIHGGTKPYHHRSVTDYFYAALENMGIEEKERKERNITFHSWRHYFNTAMRAENIADSKVQTITGHKTKDMTENYTHFTAEDFKDVLKLQENILNFPKVSRTTKTKKRKKNVG